MNPVDVLMNEHRVIETVLDSLEVLVAKAGQEGKTDTASAREIVDLLRNYADRTHHGKEEDRLFIVMEQKGFSRENGPTGVMMSEHTQGRGYIRHMLNAIEAEEAGDKSAAEWFAQNARGYIHLLRNHIYKEDHCLFPMASQALSMDEQVELMASFEEYDHENKVSGTMEGYLQTASRLAERFGVDPAEVLLSAKR